MNGLGRLRHLGRAVAAAALLVTSSSVLLLGAGEAGAAGAPPAARAAAVGGPCADVLVLGARGSGQPQGGTGLGPQVASARLRVEAQFKGRRTVQAVAVTFPAAGVGALYRKTDEYFTGLETGVENARSVLSARADACPYERIVLVGYSQGAMVMHRVIHRMIERRSPVLGRLDGAVLIADGDRVANDTDVLRGGARKGQQGIGHLYRSQSGTSTARFPAHVGVRVNTVCNAGDPVCTGALGDAIHIGRHADYVGTQPVHDAADAVARSVLAVPKPTPRALTLPVKQGQAVRHQLTADVDAQYRLTWRVLPPATLPAGLTLSSGGLVSGTPTGVPQGTTPVEVRGSILGVQGAWQPAYVTWAGSAADTPRVPPPPPERTVTVSNKVTRGDAMVEDTPAYLSTVPQNYCRRDGCMLPGTEVGSGNRIVVVCQTRGARTTNGNDRDAVDDRNPELYESTLWYRARWGDGRTGFISEVWIHQADRGGLGLPGC